MEFVATNAQLLLQKPAGLFILAVLALDLMFCVLAVALIILFRIKLLFRIRERQGPVKEFQERLEVFAAGDDSALDEARELLSRLSPGVRASLFLSYSRSISGRMREQIVSLFSTPRQEVQILRMSRSRLWSRRLHAVRLLELVPVEKAVPLLVGFLRDPTPLVRLHALQMAPVFPHDEVVAAVFGMLEGPLALTGFAVKDALVRMGPSVCDRLHKLLDARSSEPALILAIEVAESVRNPGCVPRLMDMLREGPPEAAAAAARALGGFPSPETRDTLRAALTSPHEPVRSMAAHALGRIMDPAVVPDLVTAFPAPSFNVRYHCAAALKKLGEPGAKALAQCQKHEDPFVRDIAWYVGNMPDFAMTWIR
jgi:HEAT repeat protein